MRWKKRRNSSSFVGLALGSVLLLGSGCGMKLVWESPEESLARSRARIYVEMLDSCEADLAQCEGGLDTCKNLGAAILPHVR